MSRDKYYDSKKWRKKRDHILRLDEYKDRYEARYGRAVDAVVVHHIYPRDKFPEYEWEDWNLISVSVSTHQKFHKRKTRELTKEGLKLMHMTKVGVNWRNSNGK